MGLTYFCFSSIDGVGLFGMIDFSYEAGGESVCV